VYTKLKARERVVASPLRVAYFSAEKAPHLAASAAPAYPETPCSALLPIVYLYKGGQKLAERKYLWHTTARNFRKEPAMPTAQLTEETLESKSLWFHYKTRVWPEESPQRAVVHNAMRVLRSIDGLRKLGYISVPITTGREFYELCLSHPNVPKPALLEKAISRNFTVGRTFADELEKVRAYPLIFPANFEPAHQEWEQPHFQALWLEIIAEMCTSLHLGRGWNLSNGCVEEYVHVMQLRLGIPQHNHLFFVNTRRNELEERERMRNIKVYEGFAQLMELPIERGLQIIATSISWLDRNGFPSERMRRSLELLQWTNEMIQQGFYQ
jgi:hypothetical protein